MQQQPNPDSLIRLIQQSLSDLRNRIEQGERLDLSGLSRDVAALCEQLAVLPGELARPYAAELEALVALLDGLEAQLRSCQAELSERLDRLSGPDGTGG